MRHSLDGITLAAALFALGSCGDDSGGDAGQTGSPLDSFTGGIVLTSGPDTDVEPEDDDEQKLDVGSPGETEGADGDCSGMGGNSDEDAFSVIWIANSPEGTVSKIDTKTRAELARYYTGPTDGEDDPSRTSVNLLGDVAVTNRAGSVTKIAAAEASCVDANGDGTIQTSSGPADVLPFGQDECVLWHQPLANDGDNRHGPRPTAWDAADDGLNNCDQTNARLWVGWWDYANNTGRFRRLAGSTGATLDEVEVPEWDPDLGTHYGPYGGAVDRERNFWVSGRSPGPLVRIDAETLEVSRYEVPEGSEPYGIAMDANGHPWLAGTAGNLLHFDPDTAMFDVLPVAGRLRGLMVDANGHVWAAANDPCGAVQVDSNTFAVLNGNIALPGCDDPVGVSIDSEGFVWVPDRRANIAFKVDPATFAVETVAGLIEPYTYSDMTGFGLGLVSTPPAG